MHSEFHFTSRAFNSAEPRDYFINPCCFGDDVCHWLIGGLRARGFETGDEPVQEDWGWYLSFKVNGTEHLLLVGFQPSDDGTSGRWLGWVERTGVLRTLLRRRERDVLPSAIEAIKAVLSTSPDVRDVEWVE